MWLFVGSTNPVKVNAAMMASRTMWPEAQVKGIAVPSGVSAQPISDEETHQGAKQRAQAVLTAGLVEFGNKIDNHASDRSLDQDEAILGIGLEGGVFRRGDELWSTVWGVVTDQSGQFFAANGARFRLPDSIAKLILAGQEMGPAVAALVGETDIRSKQGMIGVLTQGFVNRTEEYAGIAKLALGLWYGRDWEK